MIDERVKAGMARAKAPGKRTSRPPISEPTRRRIAELHGQGVSIKRIARELGIAYGTAWNYAKGAKGRPGPMTGSPASSAAATVEAEQ